MQEHNYQYTGGSLPPRVIKALRDPTYPPHNTRKTAPHRLACKHCCQHDPSQLARARAALAATRNVAEALETTVRRLRHQLSQPGGAEALPQCLSQLVDFSDVFADAVPPLWEQAVSPRFLRRLCKLYTGADVAVDQQVPELRGRPDVERAPFMGEQFVGDRFRCAPFAVTKSGEQCTRLWCFLLCQAVLWDACTVCVRR